MAAVPATVAPGANPFGAPAHAPTNAVAAAQQQREVAEVQGAIAVAQRFPRDVRAAMDRILVACTRPTLAEHAVYTYSRGGEDISGPSIRLAEAIAQEWGNLQFGIRELEARPGESTVEAFAWDVERNVRRVVAFQVAHERHTKKGVKRLTDPRDIYELVANQGARRMRACVLAVIPGDVVEAAVRQCEVTLKAKVVITDELIASLLEKFLPFGVDKDAIERRLQRNISAITPAQVVQLGKIFNSLRDGIAQPGDFFDLQMAAQPEASAAVASVNERVRASQAKAPPAAAPAASEAPPADPSDEPTVSEAQVRQAIRDAKDLDTLEVAGGLIQFAPAEVQTALGNEYAARLKHLRG